MNCVFIAGDDVQARATGSSDEPVAGCSGLLIGNYWASAFWVDLFNILLKLCYHRVFVAGDHEQAGPSPAVEIEISKSKSKLVLSKLNLVFRIKEFIYLFIFVAVDQFEEERNIGTTPEADTEPNSSYTSDCEFAYHFEAEL